MNNLYDFYPQFLHKAVVFIIPIIVLKAIREQ